MGVATDNYRVYLRIRKQGQLTAQLEITLCSEKDDAIPEAIYDVLAEFFNEFVNEEEGFSDEDV